MNPPRLTPRDRDMIRGVLDAKCNKHIAADLGITPETVKTYLTRLYSKLGIASRLELAQWGRAYAEAERRVLTRFRETHPDAEEGGPTLEERAIAEAEVLKALCLTCCLDADQRLQVVEILMR